MLSDQSKYIIVDPQKLLEPIKNKKLEQISYLKKIIGDYFANTIIMLAYTYIEKGKFALVEKTKPHY